MSKTRVGPTRRFEGTTGAHRMGRAEEEQKEEKEYGTAGVDQIVVHAGQFVETTWRKWPAPTVQR